MKIALLGYGKEGQAAEKYFTTKFNASCDIFQDLTPEEFRQIDYSPYDIIFRSPSIPPLHLDNESSLTRYFFDHCPCPIIGVTATKGKGTTCSFIKSLLDAEGEDAYLVGNIGTPAIEVLDQLKPTSVVVYEMSSFQLWDLQKSPHIAVLGQLEPDHLNIHSGMADYLSAKTNITRHQTKDDHLVYFRENPETIKIAEASDAQKIPYPFTVPDEVKAAVKLPGTHNLDNALAAIAAVASYKNISPDEYLATSAAKIIEGLENFKGLPHRLEFIRELKHVKYYDDNFSTNPSSTRVAINAFPDNNLVVIIGGRDKTNYTDLPEIYDILKSKNIKHVILIGEQGHALAKKYPDDRRFSLADSLETAVHTAAAKAAELKHAAIKASSEKYPIVLMSPAAASFDMFNSVYDRGDQYKLLVSKL